MSMAPLRRVFVRAYMKCAPEWSCMECHAAEMRDPVLAPELERVMNQAVGISLGEAHAGNLDARLATLAHQQGSVWATTDALPVKASVAAPVLKVGPRPLQLPCRLSCAEVCVSSFQHRLTKGSVRPTCHLPRLYEMWFADGAVRVRSNHERRGSALRARVSCPCRRQLPCS